MYSSRDSFSAIYHNHSTYTHICFGLCFSHVLIICLSPLCLSVPRGNHQKHPRGGGDGNLRPPVLSAGCYCLGYKGSRDPYRISERGKHVMLHLSNSRNLIKLSQAVRCKRGWKYLTAWNIILFLHIIFGPNNKCQFVLFFSCSWSSSFCVNLGAAVACSLP